MKRKRAKSRKREEESKKKPNVSHETFGFFNPEQKRRKIPLKPQKSAMQRDSLWSILLFGEEFRKDLLKKKTKRGEKGKAEQKEAR